MAQLKNTTINATGFIGLPSGTTAQRPGSPTAGMIRYNTSLQQTEYHDGAAWRSISDSNPVATGGTVTDTEIAGIPYRVHTFTATGNSTFTVTKGGEVEYLVVAGGGSGGSRHAGGGGAGGLLTGVATVTPQAYAITVGAGGVAVFTDGQSIYYQGVSGSNSSAFGLTAIGGGGGGRGGSGGAAGNGLPGGSGGGGGENVNRIGGAGTAGQGNAGGNGSTTNTWAGGGGGGGAGAPGQNAQVRAAISGGLGGPGLYSSITGNAIFYAGGGGGSAYGNSASLDPTVKNHGTGGIGGGGAGGTQNGFAGASNTGGGGGGGASNGDATGRGGDGGSGIVIIRYRRNDTTTPSASLVRSILPASSPRNFLVQEGLVLNLDASDPLSYAGFGTTTYSSQGTIWRNTANPAINGTINGNLAFERAAPDHATFNFTNNPFVATSNFFLGNGPTAWTLNAWVRTTTTVDGLGQGAVASNASGGPVYSSIGINAGRISYWTYEGQWLRRIGNIVVNDNRWHMLTWVNFPNSTMAMYVDGLLDIDNQRSVSGNNNPIDRFGGSWTARFDGRISQISINLNRFLNSSEVTQIFNSTRWRFGV